MIGIRKPFDRKIFVAVAFLVFVVVGVITGKNIIYLKDSLNQQYKSSLSDRTQLMGLQINGLLSRWETKVEFFAQAVLQAPVGMRSTMVDSFMKSEAGIEGIQILRLSHDPEILLNRVADSSWLIDPAATKRILDKTERSIQVHPVIPQFGMILRRITLRAGEQPTGVVLFFDVKALMRSDQSDYNDGVQVYLLDQDFNDLLTRESYAKIVGQRKFINQSLRLMKRKVGSGYLGGLTQSRKKVFAAYHRLSAYPLYLVVHLDASAIKQAIMAFVQEMLQWTVFFVLLAILCARWITFNMLRNLRELYAATRYAAVGNFNQIIPVRSIDEIGQLSHSFNLMSQKVSELLASEREKARLDQAVTTAQTVQNAFFKDKSIENESLHITSFYKPASECGGDWWGRFSLADGKELILIGDATGHGVPAALVTAIAYTSVHIHIQQILEGRYRSDDPAQVLQNLNRMLYNTLQGSYCMTFLAMIVDSVNEQLIFSNGGHPFPIFIPDHPKDSRIPQPHKFPFRFLIQKKKSSNILGIHPETPFFNECFRIMPGDKFIIYTDGLTEAADSKAKQWGNRGMQRFLKQHSQLGSQILCDHLIQEVTSFNAEKDHFADDLTVVVIEYRKKRKLAA